MFDGQSPIPRVISRNDYRAALEPLMDLLNVTDRHVYADISITSDGITFYVPAVLDAEEWSQERPPSRRGEFCPAGDDDYGRAELMQRIVVKIEDLAASDA